MRTDARAMHLVQFFLPLRDNHGQPFARLLFSEVRRELAERFGGVTTYLRAPAQGLWEDADGDLCRDEVVLFEVMADVLDAAWWRAYRAQLERRFAQDEVLVRATATRLL
jgi:hypothetical protein